MCTWILASWALWFHLGALGRRDFHPHFTVVATETHRTEEISLSKVTQEVWTGQTRTPGPKSGSAGLPLLGSEGREGRGFSSCLVCSCFQTGFVHLHSSPWAHPTWHGRGSLDRDGVAAGAGEVGSWLPPRGGHGCKGWCMLPGKMGFRAGTSVRAQHTEVWKGRAVRGWPPLLFDLEPVTSSNSEPPLLLSLHSRASCRHLQESSPDLL